MTESAQAIIWSDGMDEADFRSLARQSQFLGSGSVGTGSAVAIAPGWLLSARHFLSDGAQVTFSLIRRRSDGSARLDGGGRPTFNRFRGTVITRGDSMTDLVLIQLEDGFTLPETVPFISPNPGLPTLNQLVWKVGSGIFGSRSNIDDGGLGIDGIPRGGTNIIQGNEIISREGVGPALTFQRNNSGEFVTPFEVTTASGDSGGPTYIQHNNEWFVAGTTFGVIAGTGFVESDVASNLAWIEETTGIDFPEATGGPTRLLWDADPGTPGPQSEGGTWSRNTPDFYASETRFNYTWEDDYPTTAVFGQLDETLESVGLEADVVVGGLEFASQDPDTVFALTDQGGTVTAASQGAILQADQDAVIEAQLAGSETFRKTGPANLTLSGDNATFTGQFEVLEGSLLISDGNALGLGGFDPSARTTIREGASLALSGPGLTTNEHFAIAGDGDNGQGAIRALATTDPSGAHHTLAERIELQSNATISVGQNSSMTFGGDSGMFLRSVAVPSTQPLGLTQSGEGTVVYDLISEIDSLSVLGSIAAGSGGVNGQVNLADGAELRPGDTALEASLGQFNVGTLMLESNSTLTIDLDPSSNSSDSVRAESVSGLSGTLNLQLQSLPTEGQSFLILENDGSDPVIGGFLNESGIAGTFNNESFLFSVAYDAGDGNDVAVTFERIGVPEPDFLALYRSAASLAGLDGDDALPDAMPFDEGISNLVKYAFNLDLSGPDSRTLAAGGIAGLPSHSVVQSEGQLIWRVEFIRRRNRGLIYRPLSSRTLTPGSFSPMTGTETVTEIDADWERVTIEGPFDQAVTPKNFSQVRIELSE